MDTIKATVRPENWEGYFPEGFTNMHKVYVAISENCSKELSLLTDHGKRCYRECLLQLDTVIECDSLKYTDFFGNKLTFKIVDKAPTGYYVWNIGYNMPAGFIPYCQVEKEYRVYIDTLKCTRE